MKHLHDIKMTVNANNQRSVALHLKHTEMQGESKKATFIHI